MENLNGSIYLEREIEREAQRTDTARRVLIEPASTASGAAGALELGIARVGADGLDLLDQDYRILSVRRGSARIQIGPATRDLEAHDHVGVPGSMEARIVQTGDEPLVVLDALLRDGA